MDIRTDSQTEAESLPKNDRVQPDAPMKSAETRDEPTILTLDQSTLREIPTHLRRIIIQMGKNPTQVEVMNALVIALGLETGFIGVWCCADIEDVLETYQLNWSYSFDRKLLTDFAMAPPLSEDQHTTFRFKLSLEPKSEILVYTRDDGDLFLLSAFVIESDSVMTSTRNLALPLSRYVINKKLNVSKLPMNFRNLRELSIKLKNGIFLPLRNEIFFKHSLFKSPYPSLQGMPADFILDLCKYLKRKDVVALSACCKCIRETVVPYMLRNKSKKD